MDFKERLEKIIQNGCISFALLVAKELGIFEALSNAGTPLTSQQLADSKKLKERYVRETLECLTRASIIQIISTDGEGQPAYFLPDEAKAAVHGSIAFVDIGLIGLISSAYPAVRSCFPKDGPFGINYGEETFRFLDEKGKLSHEDVIKHILDKCSGLEANLVHGINVVEFGSGSGRLLSKLAIRFPKSSFTASEVNGGFVAKIKDNLGNIPNMHFKTLDLCQMTEFPLTKFNWALAVNVLHHLPFPLVGMKNVRKLINGEGGCVTFLDTAGPESRAGTVGNERVACQYATSAFLCLPESLQVENSEAHGSCWRRETVVSMLNQAGFDVTVEAVSDSEVIFICTCVNYVE